MILHSPAGMRAFPTAYATRLQRLMWQYRVFGITDVRAVHYIIQDNLARNRALGNGNAARRRAK